jgi:hypothetical protein
MRPNSLGYLIGTILVRRHLFSHSIIQLRKTTWLHNQVVSWGYLREFTLLINQVIIRLNAEVKSSCFVLSKRRGISTIE